MIQWRLAEPSTFFVANGMLFQDHSESLEYYFEIILDRYDTISSRSRSLGHYFKSSWIARILFQVILNR